MKNTLETAWLPIDLAYNDPCTQTVLGKHYQ